MTRLLLVEDEVKDLRNAAETAESVGFGEVQAFNTIQGAMNYLEGGLSGTNPLPNGIVLDLNLGTESGFELLRLWHRTPELSRIPVVIWSVTEEQRKVCDLFKVSSFVSKWEGLGAFRRALEQIVAHPSSN